MSSYNNSNEYNDIFNNLLENSNKGTGLQKNKKTNLNLPKNNINISDFKLHNNNDKTGEPILTGDRFIPYKSNLDDNVQNFILTSSPFKNCNISYDQRLDSPSSSESKPEKNYVNFIIDNMLKNSSDGYIIRNKSIRRNNIFSFSKEIFHSEKKNKTRKAIDINTNINNKNNLNLSAKNNKKILNIGGENYNNNELMNNINTFIGFKRKGIINPDKNDLLNFENKYNISNRKIQKTPIRILDAPNLIDDFYLNVLDWGKKDILAIGLSNEIYLWNNDNHETNLLTKYKNKHIYNNIAYENQRFNNITSLSFMNNGACLGVGLPEGKIQLWDIIKQIKIREIDAHEDRICCLSWNEYILSSGSKDRYIKNFDVRKKYANISSIKKHKQEICSLKYSIEGDLLASGGNDNTVYIWDIRNLQNNLFNFILSDNNNNYINSHEVRPYAVNNLHHGAIKGMAWCPWKRHILATGGGSRDKSIKIFSCDHSKLIKNIYTGSQVCALLWNTREKELISSHGYNKNQIIIWNYEQNKKVCELKGHMNRVLYLANSPDESTLCSGSGDETLRFWQINDEPVNTKEIDDNNNLNDNVIIH